MNKPWRCIYATSTIEVHRSGWLGVWDSFISTITRRPRLTVPQDVTFSVWVKGDAKIEINQPAMQLKEH